MENNANQSIPVLDAQTCKLLNYRYLRREPQYKKRWDRLAGSKFGQLANGIEERVKGTNTIKLIHRHEVPKQRMEDVTYGSFVCTALLGLI